MAKSAFYSQHFADDRRRDLIGNARIDNLPEFGYGKFRGFRGQASSLNNIPAGFVKAVFAAQCGRAVKDEFVLHAVIGHCSVPVQKRLWPYHSLYFLKRQRFCIKFVYQFRPLTIRAKVMP